MQSAAVSLFLFPFLPPLFFLFCPGGHTHAFAERAPFQVCGRTRGRDGADRGVGFAFFSHHLWGWGWGADMVMDDRV